MDIKPKTIRKDEKPLSDYHLQFISSFIYQRSGIVLGETKRYLIESRLKTVARIAGLSGIEEVCNSLANNTSQLETLVLDALTTNETSWFRDAKPWNALSNDVLPKIKKNKNAQILQIWSAACSTGQEPYSIAIKILESGLFNDWTIRIVATDISTQVLEQAREGIYSQLEVSRGMPIRSLMKYFTQVGDVWKIKSEIRDRVTFKEHLLQKDPRYLGTFDLVFCRNVLIYFDVETKRKILNHIHSALTNDGLLALGGSETTYNISDDFETVPTTGTVFYAKKKSQHFWKKE